MPEVVQTQEPFEQVQVPVAPVATPPVVPPVVPQEDLVTRASKVQVEDIIKPPDADDFKFNPNDIDKIQDAEARKITQSAYKSFQRGFDRKFQEVAELRKQLQSQQAQPQWTPERLQKELENPDFVKAAQSLQGNAQPAEEGSMLTDQEKRELNEIKRQQQLILQQRSEFDRKQQDEQLKGKFANYDSQAVDGLLTGMMRGEIQATREHLWKVYDYDNAVKRAYHLGLQDKTQGVVEKINSVSVGGSTVTQGRSVPERKEGESTQAHFRRIALKNLEDLQRKQQFGE